MPAATAQASLHISTDLLEFLLLNNAMSTKILHVNTYELSNIRFVLK